MPLPEMINVLRHWDLGPVLALAPSTSGVMNETFLITTAERRVVLRRHRRTDSRQVEFEHAVITHAQAAGIPTPAAIPTLDGEPFVDHDGALYSLFAFARGQQAPRGELTVAHARSMGVMLARLDLALADFPVARLPPADRSPDLSPVVAAVDNLLAAIEHRGELSEQDHWALELLRSKATWLQTAAEPAWQQPPVDAYQLVHGDYQEANLFFGADSAVVDVIDWDKADCGWPPAELVRTLDLAFHLKPDLCTAMIDGYRSRHPLSLDDLDLAASNWNYSRAHDHWVLEGIYLRGDDRLRIFLEPGPYVPFDEEWQQVRSSVTS